MTSEAVVSFARRIEKLEKQVEAICLIMAGGGVQTPDTQRWEALDVILDVAKAQVETEVDN